METACLLMVSYEISQQVYSGMRSGDGKQNRLYHWTFPDVFPCFLCYLSKVSAILLSSMLSIDWTCKTAIFNTTDGKLSWSWRPWRGIMPDIPKPQTFIFILEVNLLDTSTTMEHTFRTFYVVTVLDFIVLSAISSSQLFCCKYQWCRI